MDRPAAADKNAYWFGGIGLTVLGYIFGEGWIIVAVKVLGFTAATFIVTVITMLLAWGVIYVISGSAKVTFIHDWLIKKEEAMSRRAQMAVKGGKALAVLNAAVFLGPIISAMLMLAFGFERKKVYVYSVYCAFLCAAVWCGLYSGMFWGIHAVISGPR
jgi:hypothetical protein